MHVGWASCIASRSILHAARELEALAVLQIFDEKKKGRLISHPPFVCYNEMRNVPISVRSRGALTR
jgi:hypothetical protein